LYVCGDPAVNESLRHDLGLPASAQPVAGLVLNDHVANALAIPIRVGTKNSLGRKLCTDFSVQPKKTLRKSRMQYRIRVGSVIELGYSEDKAR